MVKARHAGVKVAQQDVFHAQVELVGVPDRLAVLEDELFNWIMMRDSGEFISSSD